MVILYNFIVDCLRIFFPKHTAAFCCISMFCFHLVLIHLTTSTLKAARTWKHWKALDCRFHFYKYNCNVFCHFWGILNAFLFEKVCDERWHVTFQIYSYVFSSIVKLGFNKKKKNSKTSIQNAFVTFSRYIYKEKQILILFFFSKSLKEYLAYAKDNCKIQACSM